jgi:hypothetical protein
MGDVHADYHGRLRGKPFEVIYMKAMVDSTELSIELECDLWVYILSAEKVRNDTENTCIGEVLQLYNRTS